MLLIAFAPPPCEALDATTLATTEDCETRPSRDGQDTVTRTVLGAAAYRPSASTAQAVTH